MHHQKEQRNASSASNCINSKSKTALQNKDIQGALMHLDLAVNAFGGATGAEMNMTGTTAITTGGGTEGDGGILEGGG